MNNVVYHAYGNNEIRCEAAWSMLSCFKRNASHLSTVNVYTDNPEFFQSIFRDRVHVHSLTSELIKRWRGEIDFVHRVKIEMLRDFTTTHQGNVLYLDTDTFILNDLTSLFNSISQGNLVMHVDEGGLDSKANPILKKTHRFVSHQGIKVDNETIQIPTSTRMWNAGVLGFNSRYTGLLDNVLKLTDAMYPMFPKHVVEQLAFSHYFQQTASVQPANSLIYHYWNFKEFRTVLKEYFDAHSNATFEEHLTNVDKLNPQVLIKPKEQFENLLSAIRAFKKLLGKSWQMPDYKFW